jgi:phosphoribosylformylglycinamidine (FGAM) synthase-like enzyme
VSAQAPPAPHRELGLTDAEYELIVEQLGREPNGVELAMFSLMWSEHCGYKHSRRLLKTLPTEGRAVVMGPGENAGAVDVGDGLVVAFKVESHNHPSAVEPFQGAATGVGGILRDVFAIGARPIAILDSLRFGELESERSRFLLDRAVAGIGHYGNSIGVATVGGEIAFEQAYEHNCLVNAMCLGIAREDRLIRSAAAGVGNRLVLLGALTGRDGIGGASVLASAELGGDEAAKRPSVQIGDPFEEKKLLECCLELLDGDLLRSLQDLGAAGLTSSASEMASKGEVGIDLDVARVPLREEGMEPFEIMVSESQERMLCVVEPSNLAAVLAVCRKWEVRATDIGEVTDSRRLRVLDGGDVVGDLPVEVLVDDCPTYALDPQRPAEPVYPPPPKRLSLTDGDDVLLSLLASPNVASKRWAYEQYDSIVGSRTVRRAGAADAAVLQLEPDGGRGAIATAIDGNGRRVATDPYTGTVEAVLECARKLPQLRQPGEAAHRVAAHRVGAWARRRVPSARRAGGRRQRVALQRGPRGPDLPDAGGRNGRLPPRPGTRARSRVRAGGPRDSADRAVPARDRRLRAREAPRQPGGEPAAGGHGGARARARPGARRGARGARHVGARRLRRRARRRPRGVLHRDWDRRPDRARQLRLRTDVLRRGPRRGDRLGTAGVDGGDRGACRRRRIPAPGNGRRVRSRGSKALAR